MKKILILLLFPLISFTQNGDTNGDGFTNLEDLFNVLENWLQNVNDNDPEAISNLDEMTNLVDSLINLNQNINYGLSVEGYIEHNYQFTNCCDSSLGGGACEDNENNYYSIQDCPDYPIINTAESSGILLIRQHRNCHTLNIYVNDILIVEDYGAFGEAEVHKLISVPIKKGDEFILEQSCASYNLWNGSGNAYGAAQRLDFFSFGDSNYGEESIESNSSNSNPSIGIGSVTDLNDYDKELDMFNAQLSGTFNYDKFHIHSDILKNIYVIGSHSTGYNNNIAGNALYYDGTYKETFFIAKYDSTGVFLDMISETVSDETNNQYFLRCSLIDSFGNIFVAGEKLNSSGESRAFIRKYDSNSLDVILDVSSGVTGPSGGIQHKIYDIFSDGLGGVFMVGDYSGGVMEFGSFILPADSGSNSQGFVGYFDSSGFLQWINWIGDINLSGLDDYASSVIQDQNNNVIVSARIGIEDPISGEHLHKVVIKKYDLLGNEINDAQSVAMDYAIPIQKGIKISNDNNGNIFLFTFHDVTVDDPIYEFNSYPLSPIISNSLILFKMDNDFNVLDAINFATGSVDAAQIITLSNNDLILRSRQDSQYMIDNSLYEQDGIQYGNITHLDSNNNFIKFHSISSVVGNTESLSMNSDSNTIYLLYYRTGNFINNGITYPTGYYIVKEQF